MSLGLRSGLSVQATVVSNEFIDRYMAPANGEYVKVFLFLLRHSGEEVDASKIADALNHTEADVKRALAYWQKEGVLVEETGALPEEKRAQGAERADSPGLPEETAAAAEPELPGTGDTCERMERLSGDEEFSALLYAAQQYLGKTFTQIECEKFAWLYDGLHMSADLLEYLAEYCAEGNHTSIRYIEKVAVSWYREGIRTREDARNYTARFSKDTSVVMKAFGISGRSLGTAEQEFMKKWFREYGFDGKLVEEACNRTIKATGTASFPYADKILAGWREGGVRTLRDVEELDKRRQEKRTAEKAKEPAGRGGQSGRGGQQGRSSQSGRSGQQNRFKNFDERSYNYEEYIWEEIRNRRKQGGSGNGTE